ncbi:SCP2 sterol-binding domain-containing protein [Sorangium sp. So ce281]|uniref:SCP2 sterol-binding domain-containing protein n=1 Tax=unclassified Sorangium TaxID=2621164 RepID=UPI003F600B56
MNENKRLASLLKGWSPTLVLEATDSLQEFSIRVDSGKLQELESGAKESEHTVRLRATHQLLIDIFSGTKNPSRVFLDGDLEVFGSDRDRVKLDAISLVLWGI